MANYIKIKAVDINVANQLSDILIGGVTSVFQGVANGTGSANEWTVYTESGKSYKFSTTAKAKEWANQFIAAVTANPGGPLAIVQNTTGVKITDVVVA